MHACAAGPNLPGRPKNDTPRCHWQREVNVIEGFRMVLGGLPMPCFFATEFTKSNFLPCRLSTLTRSCETRPVF